MIRSLLSLLVNIFVFTHAACSAGEMVYPSPTALIVDRDGKTVYVAQDQTAQIVVLDTSSGQVVRMIPLPQPASDLMLQNGLLFVTSLSAAGEVYVIETANGKVLQTMNAGHMPRSPLLSVDGKFLFVLNRFENLIRILDCLSGEIMCSVKVGREPIDAVLTPDGSTLVVAQHLPSGPANVRTIAAEITFVDTMQRAVTATVQLPNGSTSVREICLSHDGKYAFCTHILARYNNPTTQLIRGWMNTNALSIIDVKNQCHFATVLLDDIDLGAANPWGVACSRDGKVLAVTHSGTHEVSLINLPVLMNKLHQLDHKARMDVSNDLSFLTEFRERIALPGNGPRSMVFAGEDVVVTEYFSNSISVVNAQNVESPNRSIQTITLGSSLQPDPVRLGEIYFHDARLCFQKWQSCSSCHPDVRADALNWDLLNDGFGNPKNTKSLLLSHETPPAMITGVRASAEVAVRAGVRHIQFATRPEVDLEAIDEYLRSLKPISSPYLVDGELSPAAQRGRDIFHKAQCSKCHNGPYFTDLKQYDLGLGKGQDKARPMDTPTLIEVWRTAPYLYDGRAPDLRSLLIEHNSQIWHGGTSTLSESELEDLIEYLLSL